MRHRENTINIELKHGKTVQTTENPHLKTDHVSYTYETPKVKGIFTVVK